MSTRILVVEDEPKVASFIKKGLEEQGYGIFWAPKGQEAIKKAQTSAFDLALIDVNLPDISGFELTRILRDQYPKLPVIMLTALGTTEDKLRGFDSGADDYLVKPFEFRELLARIKALLKRSNDIGPETNIIGIADLEMNLDEKTVKRAGQKIELSAKEFSLLHFLIKNKGKVLSRAFIAEKVWDIHFDTGTNVIDVYINFLRKKIDKDHPKKLINTMVGMGYVLRDE